MYVPKTECLAETYGVLVPFDHPPMEDARIGLSLCGTLADKHKGSGEPRAPWGFMRAYGGMCTLAFRKPLWHAARIPGMYIVPVEMLVRRKNTKTRKKNLPNGCVQHASWPPWFSSCSRRFALAAFDDAACLERVL